MAKKSRKIKQRQRQAKKSRKGQTRSRRSGTGGASSLRSVGSGGMGPEIVFTNVSRDAPLVEDGYRIVGPAQAMVDYARPLIDKAESEEDLTRALDLAQKIWNLAIPINREREDFEVRKKELIDSLDMPDAEDVVNMMMERFDRMFPYVGREMSFYMRERVIDVEEYETFDESTLHISESKIPPTEAEIRLAKTLSKIDIEEDESGLSEWRDEILDCYVEWCIAKGIQEYNAGAFAYIAVSYLDFLKDYHGEVVSQYNPPIAIVEFMDTFFIRKVDMPAREKSMMPAALKLFMQYLDEKGITGGTRRLRRIIESGQDEFQKNLRLYTDPSLGGKVVHPGRTE